MKCPKCEGRGYVSNPRYFSMGCAEAYERGITASKKCTNCNGSGFILGNIQDIAHRLERAIHGVTITPKEAKQMYDAIMK